MPADDFTEIDPAFFMPGHALRASLLLTIKRNIDEAVLTPEFFGPTDYANGQTVPLPVSLVDGYVYTRSECIYVTSWSDTTNNAGGTHIRLPLFLGSVNQNTGLVTLQCWRLPPGGPYVDDYNANARIRVITIGIRQSSNPEIVYVEPIPPPPGPIPGEGGAVIAEIPTGTPNGSLTTFGLSQAPNPAASLRFFYNGAMQRQGIDYLLSGSIVSTTFVPETGADLLAYYRTDGSAGHDNEIPAGAIDGANAIFALAIAPNPAASLELYLNGELLLAGGVDYTLTETSVVLNDPPEAGSNHDWLRAFYRADGSTLGIADAETPSGSGTAFTFAHAPLVPALIIFENGLALSPATHYTVSTTALTLVAALPGGDSLTTFYRYTP